MLNSTNTDSSYARVAQRLCNFLPEDLKHTCEDSVHQLPSSVYRCAVQEVRLNTICSDPAVGMCKTPYKPLAPVSCKDLPEATHTCAACKFVVGGLSHYALSSMDQMVSTVKSVCMVRFRDEVGRKLCEKFVEEEGENVLRVVVSRIDAQEFCCAAGICQTPPFVVDHVDPAQLAMPVDAVGPVSEMMDAFAMDKGGL